MCGRITLATPLDLLMEIFGLLEGPKEMRPRFNIAPGTKLAVVPNDGKRALRAFLWGLVPPWTKDPAKGFRAINARVETAAEKPSFREAFHARRCLVLADGFYEWRRNEDGTKTPFHIRRKDRRPFAFAGIHELWRDPESGAELRTCAILTTSPNPLCARIHDRMPVILEDAGTREAWIEPGPRPPDGLRALCGSLPEGALEAFPVSPRVNRPANDGPDLLVPAGPPL